jgi:hypothetical protein
MKGMSLKTKDESNRRWGLALLIVGVIGLLLGSWSLIVGPSAPWVLLWASSACRWVFGFAEPRANYLPAHGSWLLRLGSSQPQQLLSESLFEMASMVTLAASCSTSRRRSRTVCWRPGDW